MHHDTSGPAFPVPGLQDDENFNGMSLRDYFAANAMQGLIGRAWDHVPEDKVFDTWASSAYAVADAMLKARTA